MVICNVPCSMQHALSTLLTYPGSCKKELFCIPVFARKISLIFLIIYQLTCQWVLANLTQLSLWSLLTGPWMTELSSFNQFGTKSEPFSQFAHRFHRDQTVFGFFRPLRTLIQITHTNLHLFWSDHAKTSLVDDCAWGTQGVQLLDRSDPGLVRAIRFRRMWKVGTPAFDAECSKLSHLMACMSNLCRHLNLPILRDLHRPPHFKHWSVLNSKLFVAGSVRVWTVQLCS